MFGLLRWKLRWKFLGITLAASIVPLVLYASFPLRRFLAALHEIEAEVLKEDLREVEALVRSERSLLEEAVSCAAGRVPDMNPFSKTDLENLRDSLIPSLVKTILKLDLAAIIEPDGSIRVFLGDEIPSRLEKCRKLVLEETCGEIPPGPFSGLIDLSGKIYLIAVSSIPPGSQSQDHSLRGFLAFGVSVDSTLIPYLQAMTEHHVVFGETTADEALKSGVGVSLDRHDEWVMSIKKRLPGLDEDKSFFVRIDMARGLYSRIEQNQVWSFFIFIGSLYLAALIGTAWAASIVRKPVAELSRTMASVSGPDTYSIRADESRTDEVGELARSFNRLMERLRQAEENLERTRKQVSESERLETIHAMVITLAHEINNPLTYILGQTELLLMEDHLNQQNRATLEVVRDMSLRISEVLKRLQALQKIEMTTYLDWQKMIKWETIEPVEHAEPTTRPPARSETPE